MDSTISIACPDCQKSLKGPQELLGKKVRCKSCGHVFVVTASPPSKAKSSAGQSTKSGSSAKTAPAKPSEAKSSSAKPPSKSAKAAHQEEDSGGSYKISDEIHVAARCPQCAANMEEDDIICLNCGYNTETRRRMEMVKTYETTGGDRFLWLLPGVLCVIVAIAFVGFGIFLWIWLWEEEGFWRAVKYWGSIFSGLIAWSTGKFAFKRLIMNPTPPEKLKR